MGKKDESNVSKKINKWITAAKDEENYMNLEELARLTGKEIKQKIHAPASEHGGLFMISQRSKVWKLDFYYNNPERYFYDTYLLMRNLRDDIQGEKFSADSYVSFKYPDNKKTINMSLIHYVFNLIIWLPLFILELPIDKSVTFMPKEFNNKTYINFINNKIIEPYKHLTTHNEMSMILAKMYDMFIFMCERYGLDLGLSFSIYDFISKWNDNKELYELNHTKIPKDMQISESEDYLNSRLNRYKEIMMDDPEDNVLKPLLRAQQGVNSKQLREMVISGGFKPDLSGNTYTIYPRSNLLTDGYRNPTDFVIDAVGGRKAGVLALQIDAGGYLARAFGKSVMDLYLNPNPDYDCGSVNYYEKTINDKKDLEDMTGRWYLADNNHIVQLLPTDYELVGKKLKFRSPTTCASKHGICATCYGNLYSQNKNINIGLNSSLKLSEKNLIIWSLGRKLSRYEYRELLETCKASMPIWNESRNKLEDVI